MRQARNGAMSLVNFIENYAYAGVAIGAVLEGEAVVALAGMAARSGHLNLLWVIAVAAAGGLVADSLAFSLGRLCGTHLVTRSRRLEAVRARVHRLLERHRVLPVLGIRFAYGVRIPALI